jgi:chromosomal replication initiator protein
MKDADAALWPDMLSYLRTRHADICRQWFEQIEELGANAGVLTLRTSSDIQKSYLERQCADRFDEAVQDVTGRLLSVQFIGPRDPAPASLNGGARRHREAAHNGEAIAEQLERTAVEHRPASDIEPKSMDGGSGQPAFRPSLRPPKQGTGHNDKLLINPDYTFDNFVVGPENKMAHAAARAVAATPGRAYNPLFVHGGVGLGKSHLLQAICLELLEREPEPWIHYVSCEAFSTEFFEAVQAGQLNDFRHLFRDVDCLVIDDIHFLTKRDQTQEEFFHTFNTLYQAGKQIVLSSDAPPAQIPDLEQRLVSRFNSGLVVEIMQPGYETRIQIVKNKARLRGVHMPDDAACYIAAKVDTNIREIEGAITKVHMQSLTDQSAINEALARRALGADPADPKPEVRITNIIDVVIDHFGVKLTDLLSRRKPKSIALPRQVCMYLAREHTRLSLQEIGGHFGGRDHTTVMHAHRVIREKRTRDEDFDRLVGSLESRF